MICYKIFCVMFSLSMPRNYKRKTTRGMIAPELMQKAALEVLVDRQSLRSIAETYGIDKMTLFRYCHRAKKCMPPDDRRVEISDLKSVPIGYAKPHQIFSDAEEGMLVEYILKAANMYFGLCPAEIKQLAYEYAVQLGKYLICGTPTRWQDVSGLINL